MCVGTGAGANGKLLQHHHWAWFALNVGCDEKFIKSSYLPWTNKTPMQASSGMVPHTKPLSKRSSVSASFVLGIKLIGSLKSRTQLTFHVFAGHVGETCKLDNCTLG